jgi:carbon monoxide dehydrogenase subunit G
MAFEITKTFTIQAPTAKVWAFLTDPRRVAKCLPGAAVTDQLDEKTWTGTMTVKVGPVQSSYKGKVVFEKLDPAAHSAEIVATGQDTKGKGGADLRLTSTLKELPGGATEVTTVSRVNVTGILAQMGRGMIQDVSEQMFQVFSQRMRSELESAAAPAVAPAAAPAVAPAATPAVAPAAVAAPRVASSAVQAAPAAEALDLGSLGARVALRRPEVWIAICAIGVALYLLLR